MNFLPTEMNYVTDFWNDVLCVNNVTCLWYEKEQMFLK